MPLVWTPRASALKAVGDDEDFNPGRRIVMDARHQSTVDTRMVAAGYDRLATVSTAFGLECAVLAVATWVVVVVTRTSVRLFQMHHGAFPSPIVGPILALPN